MQMLTQHVLQLYVMPSRRLTQKGGAKLESIGNPTGILQSLGPYITGEAYNSPLSHSWLFKRTTMEIP